jgi:putative transcriptional regulator
MNNFANQFLVAMPQLNDAYFNRSVLYVFQHNEEGAMGVVINKPSPYSLKDIFKFVGVKYEDVAAEKFTVLKGGPVASDQVFLLQRNALKKHSEIQISASRADLAKLAETGDLDNTMVFIGYSGWSANQLDRELMADNWLLVPASEQVMFNTPFSQRWQLAAKLVGVDITSIIGDAGHA